MSETYAPMSTLSLKGDQLENPPHCNDYSHLTSVLWGVRKQGAT